MIFRASIPLEEGMYITPEISRRESRPPARKPLHSPTRPPRMTKERLTTRTSSEFQPGPHNSFLSEVLAAPSSLSQQGFTTAPHDSRTIDAQQDIGHDRRDIDPSLLPFDSGPYSTLFDLPEEQITAKASTLRSSSEPRLPPSAPQHAPPKNFACPYHKRQPGKYLSSSCFRHGFPSIDRVKEHLYRRHESQPHCTRCYATFHNPEQLKQHQEIGPCLPAPDSQKPPVEGITKSMKQQLQKRHRGLTAEQKWTILYKVLFPEAKEIPSPYHEADQLFDHSISSEVLEFAHFSQSMVPNLTRSHAEKAIRERRLEGLDELLDLLPELSRTAGAEALDLWRAKKYLDDSTAPPALGVDEAFGSQSPTSAPNSGPAHSETTPFTVRNSTSVSSAEGTICATSTSSPTVTPDYVCKLCGRPFSRKSNAIRHEKYVCTMISQRPRHQCSSCGKSYHRSDALKNHIAKEHPELQALQSQHGPGKHPIREDPMELDGE